MKIGIDAHNLEGKRSGVGRYLINILKEWKKENPGHLFVLYFKQEIPKDEILKNKIFCPKLLSAPLRIQSHALFEHSLLPKAAKKDKVDILFCPGYVAPIFYKDKIALTLHDIIYEACPELYSWPSQADKILLKKVSFYSAKKANLIFVPSQFTKNEIIKYYQVDPSKICITPESADEKFKPQEYGQKIKQKYGVRNKFIFYVGNIYNRRHVPEIIEAFRQIAQKFKDLQLLIAGLNYTSPFIDFQSLIKERNTKLGREAILYKNYVDDDDLVLLYNAAELFIWLSTYEGFGLPPLEAMACGTPAITSNFTSLPEVVGNSAILVKDPHNIKEITKALQLGLSNEQLRKELTEKGLARAKEFSWKKCARLTLESIENII